MIAIRLTADFDQTRALLATLPRCNGCRERRTATRVTVIESLYICDSPIHTGEYKDLPYAPLVRQLLDATGTP